MDDSLEADDAAQTASSPSADAGSGPQDNGEITDAVAKSDQSDGRLTAENVDIFAFRSLDGEPALADEDQGPIAFPLIDAVPADVAAAQQSALGPASEPPRTDGDGSLIGSVNEAPSAEGSEDAADEEDDAEVFTSFFGAASGERGEQLQPEILDEDAFEFAMSDGPGLDPPESLEQIALKNAHEWHADISYEHGQVVIDFGFGNVLLLDGLHDLSQLDLSSVLVTA